MSLQFKNKKAPTRKPGRSCQSRKRTSVKLAHGRALHLRTARSAGVAATHYILSDMNVKGVGK